MEQTELINDSKKPKQEPIDKAQASFMSLDDWNTEFHQCAVDHGWWDDKDRNVGEVLFLAVGELVEAFEEWRNGRGLTEVYYNDGSAKPEGFPIEIADCYIRLGDNMQKWGIDIEEMIRVKHNYNLTRPYRHGGKKA